MPQAPVPFSALIALWRDTHQRHELSGPASEAEIDRAESKLGVRLPQSFRELYRFSNGLSLNDGNLTIHPLLEPDRMGALVSMSDQLRAWEWPVPPDVLVFGANGSGEPYRLWTGPHDAARFPEPIVLIGGIFEPGCMGLAAYGLLPFLLEETVIGLVLSDDHEALTRHLAPYGLPAADLPASQAVMGLLTPPRDAEELTQATAAGDRLGRLGRWCHGGSRPEQDDPYAARLNPEAVRYLLQ